MAALNLKELLNEMWEDYCQLNPKAKNIHDLLEGEQEIVVNDHIALRTFEGEKVGLQRLGALFKQLGYREIQSYHFEEKKLFAKHYERDIDDPKIFISELKVSLFSTHFQNIVEKILFQISDEEVLNPQFVVKGRLWQMTYADYLTLAQESEYGAWLAAIGFRPNHFTVSVNHLKNYSQLEVLNAFLESHGYVLNTFGGKIKGTPNELLEQSSTVAEKVMVNFQEGNFVVPGCYYEFAKRYPDAKGNLYQGFIAQSADKIFESTHRY